MVNKWTDYNVSNFFDTKSCMLEPILAQFENLRQANKPVKMVGQGDARENKKIKLEVIKQHQS